MTSFSIFQHSTATTVMVGKNDKSLLYSSFHKPTSYQYDIQDFESSLWQSGFLKQF